MRVEAVLTFLFSLVLTKFTVIAIDDNTEGYPCDKPNCEKGSCWDGSDPGPAPNQPGTTSYKVFKNSKWLSFYPKGKDPTKDCVNACKGPGCGGDPHFKKWDGKTYSYHGQGDFVLVRNDNLEIQVRTTVKDFYSYVDSAAVRIGEDVFELGMSGFWINGIETTAEDLPIFLPEFTVNSPIAAGTAMVYRVDVKNGDRIDVRTYKHFLSVDIDGRSGTFADSMGLLGQYGTGLMLARDGKTIMSNEDEFGAEWQVHHDEMMLFHGLRSPQHPEPPVLPSAESTSRRLLLSKDEELVLSAQEACAHKDAQDFEYCVFDVLATGDEGMAGSW